jgi:hypothetical protein
MNWRGYPGTLLFVTHEMVHFELGVAPDGQGGLMLPKYGEKRERHGIVEISHISRKAQSLNNRIAFKSGI